MRETFYLFMWSDDVGCLTCVLTGYRIFYPFLRASRSDSINLNSKHDISRLLQHHCLINWRIHVATSHILLITLRSCLWEFSWDVMKHSYHVVVSSTILAVVLKSLKSHHYQGKHLDALSCKLNLKIVQTTPATCSQRSFFHSSCQTSLILITFTFFFCCKRLNDVKQIQIEDDEIKDIALHVFLSTL